MNINLLNFKNPKPVLLLIIGLIIFYFVFKFFVYDYNVFGNTVFRINKISGNVCWKSMAVYGDNWNCSKKPQVTSTSY